MSRPFVPHPDDYDVPLTPQFYEKELSPKMFANEPQTPKLYPISEAYERKFYFTVDENKSKDSGIDELEESNDDATGKISDILTELSEFEDKAEDTGDTQNESYSTSEEHDIEEVFEKRCMMAETVEVQNDLKPTPEINDDEVADIKPTENHKIDTEIAATKIDLQPSPEINEAKMNQKKELDMAAAKRVAEMLLELQQPVRLRVQPIIEPEVAEPELKHPEDPNRGDETENKLLHVGDQQDNYLAPELEEIEKMEEEAKQKEYKMEIVWVNVAVQVVLHLATFYGLYLAFADASWKTNLWMGIMTLYAGNSITAGAHRMWTHKAYKANFGVRLFFMIGTTMSVQNDVIEWARDHRVHHKWADSDADPHNIKRGFFFSHMGWLMVKKHPKVKEMGAKIDMSDLEADPLLAFQRKYYIPLVMLGMYFLTAVPVYCWGESWTTAYFVAAILRLSLQLHGTWFINSAAHTFGYKPFDTKVTAVDTFFYACITNGEAWHNYHHTFPQDYRASEYMWKGNMSATLIDFFAYMGWVWDRKTMSKEAIERQKLKGDHSRPMTAAHED